MENWVCILEECWVGIWTWPSHSWSEKSLTLLNRVWFSMTKRIKKTNSTQNAFVFWRGFFIITIIISFVLLSNFKKIVFTPHYYWGHFHYFEFLSSEVVEAAASLLLLWPQTPLWPLTQLGSAKAVDATAFAEARAHSLNTFRRFGSGRLLTELSIEVGLHH